MFHEHYPKDTHIETTGQLLINQSKVIKVYHTPARRWGGNIVCDKVEYGIQNFEASF